MCESTRHATCIHASMEYAVSVSPRVSRGGMGGTEASLLSLPSPVEERFRPPALPPILVSLGQQGRLLQLCITYPYTP